MRHKAESRASTSMHVRQGLREVSSASVCRHVMVVAVVASPSPWRPLGTTARQTTVRSSPRAQRGERAPARTAIAWAARSRARLPRAEPFVPRHHRPRVGACRRPVFGRTSSRCLMSGVTTGRACSRSVRGCRAGRSGTGAGSPGLVEAGWRGNLESWGCHFPQTMESGPYMRALPLRAGFQKGGG